MGPSPTRRRVIGITAAAAGLSLLPPGRAVRAEASFVTWRGQAMGALAVLRIHHTDRRAAERLVERAVAEVRRLERIFSLYREDSALAALNRAGVLPAPPAELVALLGECRRYWEITGGAFDPTVQALWSLHRAHFAKPGADPAGPPAEALRAALDTVGFRHVAFDRDRIVLGRPGMGLTLNGIAQGYATDRAVELLRAAGIAHSLVDMGESRAVGERPEGGPWRVGIADPEAPDRVVDTLEVVDRAVATSAAAGFRFDPQGRFNHLFDPRSGACAGRYRNVTVVAASAAVADALSTAFSLMPAEAMAKALAEAGGGEARLATAAGGRMLVRA